MGGTQAEGGGLLQPGDTCWRIAPATRASVIIDADDYFRHARAAMLEAKRRIMLVGWDFDARIRFAHDGVTPAADGGPATVGDFIYWLVDRNPALEVYLLRWDLGAIKTWFRGVETITTMIRWMRHPRIHTKLDGTHPPGGSHHQKIVVIDDCFAFCGGIDMTSDRWDTRAHRDDDPARVRPNGQPYPPWHDVTTALQGPVAAALGDLCRERWSRAGGHQLAAIDGAHYCWPDALAVDFADVDVAIARSEPEMTGHAAVVEIERLYLHLIARAKRWIYAESQYFASRRIAEAISARLAEPDGPEIVVINPLTAQGWLEPIAMDTARARLFAALKQRDVHDRLRLYHPYTPGGVPIYVHAKVLVIDDDVLRIGSSNMNNRSMRLDTECDVAIDGAQGDNRGRVGAIRAVRDSLIAEHMRVDPTEVAEGLGQSGSLVATIEALRPRHGTLRPYEEPDVGAVTAWLADNEVLDPEGPAEMFEAVSQRGLFRRRLKRGP